MFLTDWKFETEQYYVVAPHHTAPLPTGHSKLLNSVSRQVNYQFDCSKKIVFKSLILLLTEQKKTNPRVNFNPTFTIQALESIFKATILFNQLLSCSI